MRPPLSVRRALAGTLGAAALALALVSCGGGAAPEDQPSDPAEALQDLADQLEDELGELGDEPVSLGAEECGDLWVGDSCEMLVGYAENFQPVKAEVTVLGLASHEATKEERQLGCGADLDLAPIWDVEVKLENLTDVDVSGLDWMIDVGLAGPDETGFGFPVDSNAAALEFGPPGPDGVQTVVTPIAKCPPSDGYRVAVMFSNSGNTGSQEWAVKAS